MPDAQRGARRKGELRGGEEGRSEREGFAGAEDSPELALPTRMKLAGKGSGAGSRIS